MRVRVQAILVAAVMLAAGSRARAYTLQYWDLDRLVENATVIVEGTVTGVQGPEIELRVTQVYRGEVKEAGVLNFGAYAYRKTEDKNFEVGDRVVCFLNLRGPGARPAWQNLPGGLKLVADGKVVEITQRGDGGPATAELGPEFVAKGQPTEAEFATGLRASLARFDAARAEVDKARVAKDGRRLVGMLKEWVGPRKEAAGQDDQMMTALIAALVEVRDFDALAEAMLTPGLNNAGRFEKGFYSPEGREYLLKTLADPAVPVAKRMACASAFPYQGAIEGPPRVFSRDPHYIKRLADAAAGAWETPALAAAIIGHIGGPYPSADFTEAMEVLSALHGATRDSDVLFAIEEVFAVDLAAYNGLHPIGGPIAAWVRLRNEGKLGRNARVELDYDFHFADGVPRGARGLSPSHTVVTQWVLRSAAGKIFEGAVDRAALNPRGDHQQADRTVVIPADVPAGKYALSFRMMEGEKVLGESHSAEVEVGP